jgi:nickel-dependent lactate racemase
MVVEHAQLAGLFVGSPENAWDQASDLSRTLHITYMDHPFQTVLSCAPRMYDELWVGGKCMYKLEPVVADGGELIIYAPHIHEISLTHGALIRRIGYHCRDYFLKQWDQYKKISWGVLAHSTHVRGIGTYADGIEHCRVQVTLATGIPRELCVEINLGYRNPSTIDPKDFANREAEGVCWYRKPERCCTTCASGPIGRVKCENGGHSRRISSLVVGTGVAGGLSGRSVKKRDRDGDDD